MKPVRIKIKTDNEAFDNQISFEVARILHELAEQFDKGEKLVPKGDDPIPLYDINRKRIGECTRR